MSKIEGLKKAINKHSLMRKHGLPFLMPILKTLQAEHSLTINESLRTMISNHVEAKYERITDLTGIAAKKQEWKTAFLSLIEEDFINKGLKRENIALEALKNVYPDVLWNGNVPWDIENQGIDITGNGFSIGVSVKGPSFKNSKDYEKHKQKLKHNQFKKVFIAYVNENIGKVTKFVEFKKVVQNGK